jgi:hypothetical protein
MVVRPLLIVPPREACRRVVVRLLAGMLLLLVFGMVLFRSHGRPLVG